MMTLAWKRTFAEWARFSKAVISVGEKWENLSNVLVREQASLVTMLLCSPYFSDVCKGQQGMKEIRFGANRSWCFLKHSKMRWDSDCQRYWVYLRTNAYLSLHEVLVNVLDAGVYVRACVRSCVRVCVCARRAWGKYNGIILSNATRQKTPNFRFFLYPISLPTCWSLFSLLLSVVLGPVSVQTEVSSSFVGTTRRLYINRKYRYIYWNNFQWWRHQWKS